MSRARQGEARAVDLPARSFDLACPGHSRHSSGSGSCSSSSSSSSSSNGGGGSSC